MAPAEIYPVQSGDGWLRPALSAILMMIAGLLAAVDAGASEWRPVVSENEGSVCIWRGHTGGGAEVMFTPALGCLSSSCTRPVAQSFSVRVIPGERPEIAMQSRFEVAVAPPETICTADCGGGLNMQAKSVLTALVPGTYRLTLGGKVIGELDTERLKGDPFNRICFGRRPLE